MVEPLLHCLSLLYVMVQCRDDGMHELQGHGEVHNACRPTENALHPFSYAVCVTLNSEACECRPVVITSCRSLVQHEMYHFLLSVVASNF